MTSLKKYLINQIQNKTSSPNVFWNSVSLLRYFERYLILQTSLFNKTLKRIWVVSWSRREYEIADLKSKTKWLNQSLITRKFGRWGHLWYSFFQRWNKLWEHFPMRAWVLITITMLGILPVSPSLWCYIVWCLFKLHIILKCVALYIITTMLIWRYTFVE